MKTTLEKNTYDLPVRARASYRNVIHRTAGRRNGAITRLVSPGDLGQVIKPFVFLDLFDTAVSAPPHFGLHPHSGIATLTYVVEGSISYEDTNGAKGTLSAGGMEWMQAGRGAWHSGSFDAPGRILGFQIWLALPPQLELDSPKSIYQGPDGVPSVGPVRVLIGSYEGVTSAIEAPPSTNCLAVKLSAGQRWSYVPPTGHNVLWIALASGVVATPDRLRHGELALFETGESAVDIEALTDAELILGSAVRHPHDLVLGYYSVHTSKANLLKGEQRILDLRSELIAEGRLQNT